MADTNEQALRELAGSLITKWSEQHGDSSGTLYHYTSAEGLVGILTSQSLWMTDLRYMNDLSELQYPNDLLVQRLQLRLSDTPPGSAAHEFLSRLSRTTASGRLGPAVFSASFCEDGNLLSQWRAYRGARGGYAIGFDFFHALRLLDLRCVLRKLIYDRDLQLRLMDEAIESFVEVVSVGAATLGRQEFDKDLLPKACQCFSIAADELLLSFKHPAFQEEQEWRLLHAVHQDPRYNRETIPPQIRTYDGNIIPYYVVSLTRAIDASKDDTAGIGFPIVDVTIGPTINADLNRESVRGILMTLAPDVEPRISDSGIPLRWL